MSARVSHVNQSVPSIPRRVQTAVRPLERRGGQMRPPLKAPPAAIRAVAVRGFGTASGKPVRVSAAAAMRGAALLQADGIDTVPTWEPQARPISAAGQPTGGHGFSTAKGSKVVISEAAKRKVARLVAETEDPGGWGASSGDSFDKRQRTRGPLGGGSLMGVQSSNGSVHGGEQILVAQSMGTADREAELWAAALYADDSEEISAEGATGVFAVATAAPAVPISAVPSIPGVIPLGLLPDPTAIIGSILPGIVHVAATTAGPYAAPSSCSGGEGGHIRSSEHPLQRAVPEATTAFLPHEEGRHMHQRMLTSSVQASAVCLTTSKASSDDDATGRESGKAGESAAEQGSDAAPVTAVVAVQDMHVEEGGAHGNAPTTSILLPAPDTQYAAVPAGGHRGVALTDAEECLPQSVVAHASTISTAPTGRAQPQASNMGWATAKGSKVTVSEAARARVAALFSDTVDGQSDLPPGGESLPVKFTAATDSEPGPGLQGWSTGKGKELHVSVPSVERVASLFRDVGNAALDSAVATGGAPVLSNASVSRDSEATPGGWVTGKGGTISHNAAAAARIAHLFDDMHASPPVGEPTSTRQNSRFGAALNATTPQKSDALGHLRSINGGSPRPSLAAATATTFTTLLPAIGLGASTAQQPLQSISAMGRSSAPAAATPEGQVPGKLAGAPHVAPSSTSASGVSPAGSLRRMVLERGGTPGAQTPRGGKRTKFRSPLRPINERNLVSRPHAHLAMHRVGRATYGVVPISKVCNLHTRSDR